MSPNFERENVIAAEVILGKMFDKSDDVFISCFPYYENIEIITDIIFNKVIKKCSTWFEINEKMLELYPEDFKLKIENLLTHESNHVKALY